MNNFERFIEAQESSYERALAEVKSGRKQSHWMWYIFPQLRDLGSSETAKYYGIIDIAEAQAFLQHPVLSSRLVEISTELLQLPGNDAHEILGSPDDLKLRSSMTLFSSVPGSDPVFSRVLDKFFNGVKDNKTLQLLDKASQ